MKIKLLNMVIDKRKHLRTTPIIVGGIFGDNQWQQGSGSVDEKIFGFVNKRRLYQNDFNQLSHEPKPTVEFSALFNSSWWIYGLKNTMENNDLEKYPRKNEKRYQDYFDNLRIDGVKIFF